MVLRKIDPDFPFTKTLSSVENITVSIRTKNDSEVYTLDRDFTGKMVLEFNRGGLSKVHRGEDLK